MLRKTLPSKKWREKSRTEHTSGKDQRNRRTEQTNGKDEQKRQTEQTNGKDKRKRRTENTNGKNERKRRTEKTNGKDERNRRALFGRGIGGAGRVGAWDIGWLSSLIGAVGCTAFVLRDRRGGPLGHRLAVVAYRGGRLYCICTKG